MRFDVDLHRHTIKLPDRVGPGRALEMSVVEAGPADGAIEGAPTMVFLHGFGGRAAYWAAQMEQFEDDYRVIALDLRGHGYTDAPREDEGARYDVPELVDDLVCALDVLRVPQRFIIVCHSFGGAIAAEFARRHPQRVSSMVIIASAVRFRLRWPGRLLLRVPPAILGRAHRLVKLVRKKSVHVWPPAHVVYLQNKNGMAVWDGSAALAAIRSPTLVILGHRDILFSAESYEGVARLIPGAQQVVVPVSAHQVMVERPEAVNRAIERFLQTLTNPLAKASERREHKIARRAARKELERQRPWLKFYDARTPYRIKLPSVALPRLFEVTARRYANVPALVFCGRSMRWRELDRLVNRFAHGLIERGLKPGERVLLALPNTPQWIIAYYAILKAGAVAVLLEPGGTPEQLLERVAQSRAVMLVTGMEHFAALYEALPDDPRTKQLRRVVLASIERYMGWREKIAYISEHFDEWMAAMRWKQSSAERQHFRRHFSYFRELLMLGRAFAPEVPLDVNAVAAVVYTHGTTGAAMAVPLTHRNLAANALQLRHWLPEARPGDERFLAQQALASAYGLTALVHLGMYVGATLILLPDSINELLKAVQRLRPTYFPTTPDVVRRLAHFSGVRQYGLASVRVCLVSGSSLPMEIREEFEKITRGRLIDAYGLAEAGPALLAMPLANGGPAGAFGVALPDTEVKIVDLDTGRDAGPDMPGQLWVRGPQVFSGYDVPGVSGLDTHCLRRQDEGGEWLITGDIASMDEDGFVTLIDREQDIVLRAGRRVFPRKVEEILYEHPAVALATVKGNPDVNGEMQLTATVLMHRNMHVDGVELLNFASKYLHASAVPDSISVEYQY